MSLFYARLSYSATDGALAPSLARGSFVVPAGDPARLRYLAVEALEPLVAEYTFILVGRDIASRLHYSASEATDPYIAKATYSFGVAPYTEGYYVYGEALPGSVRTNNISWDPYSGTGFAERGYYWDTYADWLLGTFNNRTLPEAESYDYVKMQTILPAGSSWTSQVLDTLPWGDIPAWDSWFLAGDIPSGSTYTVEMRTSDLSSPSEVWTTLTGPAISLTKKRYIQFRVTVNSGTIGLRELSFYWNQDKSMVATTAVTVQDKTLAATNKVAVSVGGASFTTGATPLLVQNGSFTSGTMPVEAVLEQGKESYQSVKVSRDTGVVSGYVSTTPSLSVKGFSKEIELAGGYGTTLSDAKPYLGVLLRIDNPALTADSGDGSAGLGIVYLSVNGGAQRDITLHLYRYHDERTFLAYLPITENLVSGTNRFDLIASTSSVLSVCVDGTDDSGSYLIDSSGNRSDISTGELIMWLEIPYMRDMEVKQYMLHLPSSANIVTPDKFFASRAHVYRVGDAHFPASAVVPVTQYHWTPATADIYRPFIDVASRGHVYRTAETDFAAHAHVYRVAQTDFAATTTVAPQDLFLECGATVYRVGYQDQPAYCFVLFNDYDHLHASASIVPASKDFAAKTFVAAHMYLESKAEIIRPHEDLASRSFVVRPAFLSSKTFVAFHRYLAGNVITTKPAIHIHAMTEVIPVKHFRAKAYVPSPKDVRAIAVIFRPFSDIASRALVFREALRYLECTVMVQRPQAELHGKAFVTNTRFWMHARTRVEQRTKIDKQARAITEKAHKNIACFVDVRVVPHLAARVDTYRPTITIRARADVSPVRFLAASATIYRHSVDIPAEASVIPNLILDLAAKAVVVELSRGSAFILGTTDVVPGRIRDLQSHVQTLKLYIKDFTARAVTAMPSKEFAAKANILGRSSNLGGVLADNIYVANNEALVADVAEVQMMDLVTVGDIIEWSGSDSLAGVLLPLFESEQEIEHILTLSDMLKGPEEHSNDHANWATPVRVTNNLFASETVGNPFIGEINGEVFIGYETNETWSGSNAIHVVKDGDSAHDGEWRPAKRLEGESGAIADGKLIFTGKQGVYEWIHPTESAELYTQEISMSPLERYQPDEVASSWPITLYEMQCSGMLIYPPESWATNPIATDIEISASDTMTYERLGPYIIIGPGDGVEDVDIDRRG
jgi:hypothetical protein